MDVKPFKKNRVYKRSEIHDNFGGSRQSGISTCAKYPYIFIFSGSSGERYGYFDEWLDTSESVFQYTGEDQEGDMDLYVETWRCVIALRTVNEYFYLSRPKDAMSDLLF